MRKIWMAVLGCFLLSWVAVAQDNTAFHNDKEKISYALGMDLGKQLQKKSVEVDPQIFAKGLGDVLFNQKTLLSDEEVRNAISGLQAELKRREAELRKYGVPDNKQAGEAFLAVNQKTDGVVVLPSGLQYKILKAGDGKIPTDADTVECHYRGTLINGTEFYNTHTAGKPATLKVQGGVIAGWNEALKLMPVGSKWQLFVPPQLAYGERGAGTLIGPNETLIYEVELLAIK